MQIKNNNSNLINNNNSRDESKDLTKLTVLPKILQLATNKFTCCSTVNKTKKGKKIGNNNNIFQINKGFPFDFLKKKLN